MPMPAEMGKIPNITVNGWRLPKVYEDKEFCQLGLQVCWTWKYRVPYHHKPISVPRACLSLELTIKNLKRVICYTLMTTGAFSRNVGKLFSELKLVTDKLLHLCRSQLRTHWKTNKLSYFWLLGILHGVYEMAALSWVVLPRRHFK